MKVGSAILAAVAGVALAASAQAAVLVNESFDSMGTAGTAPPSGWLAGGLANSASRVTDGGGAAVSQTLTPDDGTNLGQSAGTAGVIGKSYNYGVAGAGAVTDRAIGSMGTTNATAGTGNIGGDHILQVAVTNTAGGAIEKLTINWTVEQWRFGQGASSSGNEMLRCYYSTSASSGWVTVGLDGTAPWQTSGPGTGMYYAVDGNAAANRVTMTGDFTLPAAVAAGGTFYLRWVDWNENSTSDHALAVDDVMISATAVPEPTTLSLLGLAALPLIRRRRA